MVPERMVDRLDFYKFGEKEPIDSMKMTEPTGEFSMRLERIERGVMQKMAEDVYFEEVHVDESN